MTKEELLTPRFKVIADYPHSDMKVGQVLHTSIEATDYWKKYRHLFKPLEWWEERTVDDMCSVKYIKVVDKTGYWLIGDIIPVTGYDTPNGKFKGFCINSLNPVKYSAIIPATEEEYLAFKNK